MKRSRHPRHWPALALACKELAGWICEECGVAHGTELVSRHTGNCYRVALHAAHLDHDPANPCPRLRAMEGMISARESVEAGSRSRCSSTGCYCSGRGELPYDRHAVHGTSHSRFLQPNVLCSRGVERFEPMPRGVNGSG